MFIKNTTLENILFLSFLEQKPVHKKRVIQEILLSSIINAIDKSSDWKGCTTLWILYFTTNHFHKWRGHNKNEKVVSEIYLGHIKMVEYRNSYTNLNMNWKEQNNLGSKGSSLRCMLYPHKGRAPTKKLLRGWCYWLTFLKYSSDFVNKCDKC